MKNKNPEDLIKEIGVWSDKTFGSDFWRVVGMAEHLEEEAGEVTQALIQYRPNNEDKLHNSSRTKVKKELADCQILIFDILRKLGLSFEDHLNSVSDKFEIVKQRKYPKVPGSNTNKINHIRDEE